ncbi:hypothetical protein [Rhizobium leguminosarum]|uniref:hypothetical protein n=1 Tax=Rhizobium leguminosarum TaxID=384 RepID=UPI001C96E9CA|nr:hypothetical protein [Rhizobium leguminosarum]MBY5406339.1 hypothetical protein [Rhizobium leguminosarum]
MREIDDSILFKKMAISVVPSVDAAPDFVFDDILAGKPVVVPTNKLDADLDLQTAIDLVIKYAPLIASLLSILKSAIDLEKIRREANAADEIHKRLKETNPELFSRVDDTTSLAVVKSSLLGALKEIKPRE